MTVDNGARYAQLAHTICAALLFALPLPASARTLNPYFSLAESGHVLHLKPILRTDAQSTCLRVERSEVAQRPCKVVAYRSLGTLVGVRVSAAWYRTTVDDESKYAEVQFVLFEDRGARKVLPVWTYRYPSYPWYGEEVVGPNGIVDVRLQRTPHGSYAEFQLTSTGTGGDWTEYLRRNEDTWLPIERLHTGDLQRCLPAGFEFWHDDSVDIVHRIGKRWTRALGPDMTAGTVRYSFEIVGSRMRLKKCWHVVEHTEQ